MTRGPGGWLTRKRKCIWMGDQMYGPDCYFWNVWAVNVDEDSVQLQIGQQIQLNFGFYKEPKGNNLQDFLLNVENILYNKLKDPSPIACIFDQLLKQARPTRAIKLLHFLHFNLNKRPSFWKIDSCVRNQFCSYKLKKKKKKNFLSSFQKRFFIPLGFLIRIER